MDKLRKVAVVSDSWTACVYRRISGALAYTENYSSIITQNFHLASRFQSDNNLNTTLNKLLKWNPDALLCHLDSEPLEHLIQSLPQSRPATNMVASNPIPGVAIVSGRHSIWLKKCVEHLRHQGLHSIAYLILDDFPQRYHAIDLFDQIAGPTKSYLWEKIEPSLLEDSTSPVTPVPERLADWLRRLPKRVGVICPAIGAGNYLIRVCHELGLKVPEDVAVIGADDSDLALASSPTLTTVVTSAHQIGHEAMQLLDQMMNGKPAPTEPVRIDAMDLHVRESTGLKRAQICDIAAALEYINQHACQHISVAQLIKETQHVCKATFHKYFQVATGQTPGEAIRQRQMEEARRLLDKTELSISSIAECCGFCDNSIFSRSFHGTHGMSPMAYRKQARLKNSNSAG